MSIPTPEQDVAAFLSGALPSPYDALVYAGPSGSGGTIKTGAKRSPRTPEGKGVQIWVTPVAGTQRLNLSAGNVRTTVVQLLCLSAPGQWDDGIALARAARELLTRARVPIAAGGFYVGCRCDPDRAEPHDLGADEADQYEFTQEFTLWWTASN